MFCTDAEWLDINSGSVVYVKLLFQIFNKVLVLNCLSKFVLQLCLQEACCIWESCGWDECSE